MDTHYISFFIDIQGGRGSEYYFSNCQLINEEFNYPLTLFIEEKNRHRVPNKPNINIKIISLKDIKLMKNIEKIAINRIKRPRLDNRNTPLYFCLVMAKFEIIETILDEIREEKIAWIDFGLKEKITRDKLDRINSIEKKKFGACLIHYRPNYFIENLELFYGPYGVCSMAAGFMISNKKYWKKICQLCLQEFNNIIEKGYGHAEEQILTTIYSRFPKYFDLWYGDYEILLKNYEYIEDKEQQIMKLVFHEAVKDKNYNVAQHVLNKLKPIINSNTSSKMNSFYLEDLVIGLLACCSKEKYIAQLKACEETWTKFNNIPVYYFSGELCKNKCSNKTLHFYGVLDDYNSSGYKQWYGMKKLYELHPYAKYYYIAGTDTYARLDEILKLLQTYNPEKYLYIGGHGAIYNWQGDEFYFHSGGSGFILSNALMKYIYPLITSWMENCKIEIQKCDVSLSYLLHNLKRSGIPIETILVDKFRSCDHRGYSLGVKCCFDKFTSISDITGFHFINPEDMYILYEIFNKQVKHDYEFYSIIDKATYHRERGENAEAFNLLLSIKDESKNLDFLKRINYELSVVSYYVGKREIGLDACEKSSLNDEFRSHAFSSIKFYVQSLKFIYKKDIIIENYLKDYIPGNTTIMQSSNTEYKCITRYRIVEDDDELEYKVFNQNILTILDKNLNIISQTLLKDDFKQDENIQFLGFEDPRLIYADEYKTIFSATRFNEDNNLENNNLESINLENIAIVETDNEKIVKYRNLEKIARKEKNWLFLSSQKSEEESQQFEEEKFIYHWQPFTVLTLQNNSYKTEFKKEYNFMKYWQGSCCPILVNNNFYLSLIHEDFSEGIETYFYHRFVLLDKNLIPLKYSYMFYFEKIGIEYCCGMCNEIDTNNILLTYTINDEKPMVTIVSKQEIFKMLIYNIE